MMRHSKLPFTRLAYVVVLTAIAAIAVVVFWNHLPRRFHDWRSTNGDAALQGLLADWGLEIRVTYKLVQYAQGPAPTETGAVLKYFKLDITHDDARAAVLQKNNRWPVAFVPRTEFPDVRPSIPWWRSDPGAAWYTGGVTARGTPEFLRFNLVIGRDKAYVLVESLTHPGRKRR